MSNILIAEDEQRISDFVQKGLRSAGYDTTTTEDGETALMMARTGRFDMVLLDLGLPALDGLEVLRRLRGEGVETPVIILTGRDSMDEAVAGLVGPDDYLTKPFRFADLLAQVQRRLNEQPATSDSFIVQGGDLQLDVRTRRVDVEGRSIDLSARETALLEVLLRRRGKLLSREQILCHLADCAPASPAVLDVLVRVLGTRIGAERIETPAGGGVRLR